MGWIKVRLDPIPPIPAHTCLLPHWGSVDRHMRDGSIWRCDECGKEYELVWGSGRGDDEGMPMANFRLRATSLSVTTKEWWRLPPEVEAKLTPAEAVEYDEITGATPRAMVVFAVERMQALRAALKARGITWDYQ